MDLVLGALTTCRDITYKAYATALGIDLQKVETACEGDLDLRGFLGVDESVRKGFQVIRGTVTLRRTLMKRRWKLKGAVDSHCPCARRSPDSHRRVVKALPRNAPPSLLGTPI